MADRSSKAEEILDTAEAMARESGFSGFSFREIATAVGIKSASVHYHFPTKDDLGVAMVQRYTDRFMATLGEPDDPARTPDRAFRDYVAAFAKAAVEERKMCLCGMFGAEILGLPLTVASETRRFFDLNRQWLKVLLARFGIDDAEDQDGKAFAIIATLEGALLLSQAYDDPTAFERAVAGLGILNQRDDSR